MKDPWSDDSADLLSETDRIDSDLDMLLLSESVAYKEAVLGQEAPWLLSQWTSTVWITTNGNKTLLLPDGSITGGMNYNWDVLLPDGYSLCSAKYSFLLESCRRIIFLYREGYVSKSPPAPLTSQAAFFNVVGICRWLVLNRQRYDPENCGLLRLDSAGVKEILAGISAGGWCAALSLTSRVLSALYERAYSKSCPPELLCAPYAWPESVCQRIRGWLQDNNHLKFSRSSRSKLVRKLISYELIAELGCVDERGIHRNRELYRALFQFFPDEYKGVLLQPAHIRSEYPNQKVETIGGQEVERNASLRSIAATISCIRKLQMIIPQYAPVIDRENVSATLAALKAGQDESGHTRFIPIDVGLAYLREAVRWVYLYGDFLVDYYISIFSRLAEINLDVYSFADSRLTGQVFSEIEVPEELNRAGFHFTCIRHAREDVADYDLFRRSPSLQDAMNVLVGACTILISILKPSRDCEIESLPFTCLAGSEKDGYWLDSELGKRTDSGLRAHTGGQPVPHIVAKAVMQMQALHLGFAKVLKDDGSPSRAYLFYLPNPSDWSQPRAIRKAMLNGYIDKFCDYVALPADEQGRRWYIRIHESRKWFLILFVWSGKYDVLDAARWIAGHTDIKHLYAYVVREFPGDQLGRMEAECAIERLLQLELSDHVSNSLESDIYILYQEVLAKFRVDKLRLIPERQWRAFVEYLFEGDYHIEPISLESLDGSKRIDIAVRRGPRI